MNVRSFHPGFIVALAGTGLLSSCSETQGPPDALSQIAQYTRRPSRPPTARSRAT